jgi:hypothetical protein
VAITPFAIAGLRFGGLLWNWFSMAVYAVGLARFARDVLPAEWSRSRSSAFLALGAVVALPGLWNAQSNTLVVGLLLLAASGVVRQHWWTAAILLAAATWIKLTPLALVLILCVLCPRRLAPRLIVALLAGAVIPFLTRPPGIVLGHYASWVEGLFVSTGTRWPGFRDGWTIWVVVSHLSGTNDWKLLLEQPMHSASYPVLQLATAALTLLWCLQQRGRGTDTRRLVCGTFAMAMAWLMLFGPAVEHATYTFLAPSLSWALLEGRAWPRGRWLIGAAFVLIALLGWYPLTHPLTDYAPLLLAALPLGTILFVLWLIGWAGVRRDQLGGSPADYLSVLPASRATVRRGAECRV